MKQIEANRSKRSIASIELEEEENEEKTLGLILYKEDAEALLNIPEKEASEIIICLLNWFVGNDLKLENPLANMVLEMLKNKHSRNAKKYEITRERRREAGRIGGLKSAETRQKQVKQNRSKMKQNEANEASKTKTETIYIEKTYKKEKGACVKNPESEKKELEQKKQIDEIAESFETFWKAWPPHFRKVDKKKCKNKWTGEKLNVRLAEIVGHIEQMKKSRQWTKDNGEYIPAPLVYLNRRQWEAPPPPEQTTAQGAIGTIGISKNNLVHRGATHEQLGIANL